MLERERIFELKTKGFSIRKIARKVGRNHSTILRELSRNAKYGRRYIPCIAQKTADREACKQRFRAALKNPSVLLYVRIHLRLGWSPEIIAGRLPIDLPGESISTETIYKYIYRKKNKKEKLWQYLEMSRKKRRQKLGRAVHRHSKIPNAVSIDLRPKEAFDRKTPGHFETDNLEGKKTDTKVLSSVVERTTRHVSLALLPSKKSEIKNTHIIKEFTKYPTHFVQSLTCDNGPENTKHTQLTDKTGTPVFFCHPYHSWEKGTVERRFRTIRRQIPKGSSIEDITSKEIKIIENWINNTPMKVLNYLTPNEMMANILNK